MSHLPLADPLEHDDPVTLEDGLLLRRHSGEASTGPLFTIGTDNTPVGAVGELRDAIGHVPGRILGEAPDWEPLLLGKLKRKRTINRVWKTNFLSVGS